MSSSRELPGSLLAACAGAARAGSRRRTNTPASAAPPRPRRWPPGTSTCAPISRACRKGSGTWPGQDLWEAKCAQSCHGVFGESQRGVLPLVGGTTQTTSRPAASRAHRPELPRPHHLMKVSTSRRCGTTSTAPCPGTSPSRSARRGLRRHGLPAQPGRRGARRLHAVRQATSPKCRRRMPNRNGMTTETRPVARQGTGRPSPGPTCGPAPA
jgi:hypothetical protein